MAHTPTIDFSADVLHLFFINYFTKFMVRMILVYIFEFDEVAREPFEIYLRSIGVPMKVVKAKTVEEMAQCLNGRDAKAIISKAVKHISAMLEFAHAKPADARAAVDAPPPPARRGGADEDVDLSEEEGEEEAEEDDEDAEDRMLRYARHFDKFTYAGHTLRAWEQADTSEYRETRAVDTFNAAGELMEAYKDIDEDSTSAVPHVLLVIVPRQMVRHGDPTSRGADHSEAYGASLKDSIHNRLLRRKKAKAGAKVTHNHRDGTSHKQNALQYSRVMQAFRNEGVRERLLRDEASIPFLQRRHYAVASTGHAGNIDEALARERQESIYEKLKEDRELS